MDQLRILSTQSDAKEIQREYVNIVFLKTIQLVRDQTLMWLETSEVSLWKVN